MKRPLLFLHTKPCLSISNSQGNDQGQTSADEAECYTGSGCCTSEGSWFAGGGGIAAACCHCWSNSSHGSGYIDWSCCRDSCCCCARNKSNTARARHGRENHLWNCQSARDHRRGGSWAIAFGAWNNNCGVDVNCRDGAHRWSCGNGDRCSSDYGRVLRYVLGADALEIGLCSRDLIIAGAMCGETSENRSGEVGVGAIAILVIVGRALRVDRQPSVQAARKNCGARGCWLSRGWRTC